MGNIDKLILIAIFGTIILPIIIAFLIKPTRKFILDEFNCSPTSTLEVLLYLIIAFLISLILILPILKRTSYTINTSTELKKYNSEKNIKSLSLNTEFNSHQNIDEETFSVGMSVLNTDSYFYFFVEENEKYKLEKVNADYTYIKETDEIEPKITIYEEKEVVVTEINPTMFGKILGLKKEIEENVTYTNIENTIYIPKGSLIEKYNPNINK